MNEIVFDHSNNSFMESMSYKGEKIFNTKRLADIANDCGEVIKQAVLLMPGKHSMSTAFKNIRAVAGDTTLAMCSAFIYGWSMTADNKGMKKFIAKKIATNSTFSSIPEDAFKMALDDDELRPVADLACAFTYGSVAWGKSHKKQLLKALKPKGMEDKLELMKDILEALQNLKKESGGDLSSFFNQVN